MTLEEIKEEVANIERNKRNREVAHQMEDVLRDDFICFVSKQDGEIGEMAKEVLKTSGIKFERWFS